MSHVLSDKMLCTHEEILARQDNDMNMRLFDLQVRSQPERNRRYGIDVLVFDDMWFQKRCIGFTNCKANSQANREAISKANTVPISSSNTYVNGLYCKNDNMYEYNHQMFNNLTKQVPFSLV